jgi:hypothetical protein
MRRQKRRQDLQRSLTTFALLVTAVLLSGVTPAAAQKKPEPAKALAASKALIAKADADGIFQPGAWAFGPTALHERSGLLCRFAMDVPNRLSVNDPQPTRGDDVSCTTIVGGAIVSHFASHTKLVGDFDYVSTTALAALKARVGETSRYTDKVFDLKAAALPPIRVERLVSEQSGMKLYERVAVMDMGEWIITQRVTAPVAAGPAVDRMATMNLAAIAKEMGKSARDKPAP